MLTVKKCQGLTLPSGVLDISKQFEGLQGYVALSRFAIPKDVIITEIDFQPCVTNEEVRNKVECLKQLLESKANATVLQIYDNLHGGSEAGTAKLLDHCLNAIGFDQSVDITHPDGFERTEANVKPNQESAGGKEATDVR